MAQQSGVRTPTADEIIAALAMELGVDEAKPSAATTAAPTPPAQPAVPLPHVLAALAETGDRPAVPSTPAAPAAPAAPLSSSLRASEPSDEEPTLIWGGSHRRPAPAAPASGLTLGAPPPRPGTAGAEPPAVAAEVAAAVTARPEAPSAPAPLVEKAVAASEAAPAPAAAAPIAPAPSAELEAAPPTKTGKPGPGRRAAKAKPGNGKPKVDSTAAAAAPAAPPAEPVAAEPAPAAAPKEAPGLANAEPAATPSAAGPGKRTHGGKPKKKWAAPAAAAQAKKPAVSPQAKAALEHLRRTGQLPRDLQRATPGDWMARILLTLVVVGLLGGMGYLVLQSQHGSGLNWMVELHARMAPLPPGEQPGIGTITVTSEPAGARIYYDGVLLVDENGAPAPAPQRFNNYRVPVPPPVVPAQLLGTEPATNGSAPPATASAASLAEEAAVAPSAPPAEPVYQIEQVFLPDRPVQLVLELDGYAPVVREVRREMFLCTEKAGVPPDAPYRERCDYSYDTGVIRLAPSTAPGSTGGTVAPSRGSTSSDSPTPG